MHKPFIIILGVVLLFVTLNSYFIVDQREYALVLQFGKPVRTIKEPGLKFKVPFIQNVEYFDNRILDLNAEAREVIASDQKRVIVDAFAKYRIVNPQKFREAVRNEYGVRSRLNSILDSSLRLVIGENPLHALLSEQRSTIMGKIKDIVNQQVSGRQLPGEVQEAIANNSNLKTLDLGIEVVDVRIMRADLPPENSEAIYRRMQTEREREAKEIRAEGSEEGLRIRSEADKQVQILLAEAEKNAQIAKGEGDAEATKIFASAFSKDPEFFNFYRTMQAYEKSLDNENTTMILSPSSDFLGLFNKLSESR